MLGCADKRSSLPHSGHCLHIGPASPATHPSLEFYHSSQSRVLPLIPVPSPTTHPQSRVLPIPSTTTHPSPESYHSSPVPSPTTHPQSRVLPLISVPSPTMHLSPESYHSSQSRVLPLIPVPSPTTHPQSREINTLFGNNS